MSDEILDGRGTRRGFLKAAAPAAVIAAVAAPSIAEANGHGQSGGRIGTFPSLYEGWNARNFREIRDDENAHVRAIVQTLGGAARPKPTFRNLVARSAQQFVQLSVAFENTGVGAYLGAAPVIFDAGLLAAAASIALVEGYHSGYLNTLVNQPIVPGRSPFAEPLTIAQVRTRIAPYVASLNGGPPLTFSTEPSPENDIAIFNFALALEYLEAEYYNINVPRVFG